MWTTNELPLVALNARSLDMIVANFLFPKLPYKQPPKFQLIMMLKVCGKRKARVKKVSIERLPSTSRTDPIFPSTQTMKEIDSNTKVEGEMDASDIVYSYLDHPGPNSRAEDLTSVVQILTQVGDSEIKLNSTKAILTGINKFAMLAEEEIEATLDEQSASQPTGIQDVSIQSKEVPESETMVGEGSRVNGQESDSHSIIQEHVLLRNEVPLSPFALIPLLLNLRRKRKLVPLVRRIPLKHFHDN